MRGLLDFDPACIEVEDVAIYVSLFESIPEVHDIDNNADAIGLMITWASETGIIGPSRYSRFDWIAGVNAPIDTVLIQCVAVAC